MASALKHIALPIPWRMSTDSPSSTSPEGTSPFMYNVIPGNPRVLRRRGGLGPIQQFVSGSNFPTGSNVRRVDWSSATLYDIHYQPCDGITNAATAISGNPYTLGLYGGYAIQGSLAPPRSVYWNGASHVDDPIISEPSAIGHHAVPHGPLVLWEGITYGVCLEVWSTDDPFPGFYGMYGSHLYVSGGKSATLTALSDSTRVATISVGSKTGTFGTAPASSMTGAILYTFNTTAAASQYVPYKIVSHNGGSTSFTLDRAWGADLSAAVSLTSNDVFMAPATGHARISRGSAAGSVGWGSGALACVALYRERLFGGVAGNNSPTSGVTSDMVVWSAAGKPWYSPATNYFRLGSSSYITGMWSTNDALLIFTAAETYVLTGYDEASFTLRQLDGSVGCLSPNAIAAAAGRVYWMYQDGVYSSNGSDLQEHTRSSAGDGINQYYRSAYTMATAAGYTNKAAGNVGNCWPVLRAVGDYLIATLQHMGNFSLAQAAPVAPSMIMHIPTSAWSLLGTGSANSTAARRIAAIDSGHSTVVAACGAGAWYAPRVADPYPTTHYDGSAAGEQPIYAAVRFATATLGGDETARVKGVQVAHNCVTDAALPLVAWSLTLEHDEDLHTGATNTPAAAQDVGDIAFRDYASNAPATAMPVSSVERIYIDRFRDVSFPAEGNSFRVTMYSSANTGTSTTYTDVMRVAFLVDGTVTMLGRVQS